MEDNIAENLNTIDQSVNADEYKDINRYLEKAGQETIPEASDIVEVTVEQEDTWPRIIIPSVLVILIRETNPPPS